MTAVCELATRPTKGREPSVQAPVEDRLRLRLRAAAPAGARGDLGGVPSADARRVRSCRLERAEPEMVPTATGMRLTRRGRLALRWVVLLMVAAVAVVTVGVGSSVAGGWGADSAEGTATRTLAVQPGETLWQVAGRVAPDQDRRVVIDEIIERNDIAGADELQVGQRLVVPTR